MESKSQHKRTGLAQRLSRFAHQAVTAVSIVAMTAQPILAQSLPIVADPNAQGGLRVQTAPNGVPLVDIATPNARGLSHNTYDQFNVGTSGAILNNEAGTFGTTQLGGVVQGNANLAQSGAARVILNEVVSANRSDLRGIVEVAGRSADVIIANPNGITCDGCGFIRTPRVVLTTGTPEIADGALTGLRVEGGDVLIGANGADLGSVSLFDIVSRQVRFEGAAQGEDQVRLSVGPNRFDYTTGAVELLPGDHGDSPAFGVDSTALGGLYAGRITVMSTEQGVGVRAPAEMAANAGQMTLTADGRLVMGRAQAEGRVTARSAQDSVTIERSLFSQDAIELTGVSAEIAAGATLASAGSLGITADTVDLGAGALVVAGMTADGDLAGNGTLSITTGTLGATDARLAAAGDLALTADTIRLDQSTPGAALTVLGDARIATQTLSATGATSSIGGALDVMSTGALALTGGAYAVGADLDIAAESLTSTAGFETGGEATVTTLSGDMALGGDLEAGGPVRLTSAGDMTLTARLASGVTGFLQATGDLLATGTVVTQRDLRVAGANVTNSGALGAAEGALVVESTGDIVNEGLFYAGRDLTLSLDGTLENRFADIIAEGAITIGGLTGPRAAEVRNRSANIEAITGRLLIAAASVANEQPAPTITEVVTVTTREGTAADFPGVSHPGSTYRVVETTTVTRQVADPSSDAPSRMLAGGDLTIEADTVLNRFSQIAANGDVTLTADTVTNTGQDLIEVTLTQTVSFYTERYCALRILGVCFDRNTRYLTRTDTQTDTVTYGAVFAAIQAGGAVTADVSGFVSNDAVRSGVDQIGLSSGDRGLATPTQLGAVNPGTILNRPALFVPTGNPNAPFLIETRPEFVDVSRFLSSDYFLQQIGGYDANLTMRRFGDAYVEARLIQDQMFALTGQRLAQDPATLRALMQQFYDNALAAVGALQLTPGIALSPEQVGALTDPIIWLEPRTIDGAEVLVPVLYLGAGAIDEVSLASAQIAGARVDIGAGSLINTGAVTGAENLRIATDRDLLNIGGQIASGGDVTLDAEGRLANVSGQITGADVTIDAGTLENSVAVIRDETGNGFADRLQDEAVIAATGDLSVIVEGDLTSEAGRFAAGQNATLQAGGDITLEAAQVETLREDRFREGYDRSYRLENELAGVTAGDNLDIIAGRDLTIAGAEIDAGGDAALTAEGDVAISSVQDIRQDDYRFDVDTGWFFGVETNIREQEQSVTTQDTTITSGGNLTITAETGDLTLVAPDLQSGGQTTLAAEQGDIALLGNADSAFARSEMREEDLLWWNSEDEGFSETTRTPTRITADGGLQIVAGGQVVAEYVSTGGDFDAGIAQLAASPGLAWMGQLQEMDNVSWQQAETAFQEWDYESQGLTEAGALLVTVVTSWALGPGIETLAAQLGGQSAAMTAAFDAGLTALSNQAAVSFVNNQGDLGAVLRELGSADSLRGLVASMVSAGLVSELSASLGIGPQISPEAALSDRIAYNLQVQALSVTVNTAVDVTISGGDFDDALAGNLRNAAANVIGTVVAQNIGVAAAGGDIDRTTQLIAHAALGCVVGQVGSGDCSSGAIGAFAGELTALIYASAGAADPAAIGADLDRWQENGVSLARLAGGLAAAAAGGSANVGADAGENAAENNGIWFLIPIVIGLLEVTDKVLTARDAYELGVALDACNAGSQSACDTAADLAQDFAISAGIEVTVGSLVPGSRVAGELIGWVRRNADADTVRAIDQAGEQLATNRTVTVDSSRATRGTPEFELLNNPPANTRVELSNGTTFRTGEGGYVDEITYQPVNSSGVRDGRQTAVGREGIAGDVGGHIQACRHGGTCDRFNLFPQNSNFNNSAYRSWENEITRSLQNGDNVGNVTVRLNRADPYNPRPDSVRIEYSINGETRVRNFRNEAGG
ncbi:MULTISPECIES: DUF637 domain-containing protein [unclassified Yoonia]|uniref:two-partner secretion domain-containing protein n=1 Tax=unclassified Yoonia TaxID=2629118 RepID=UPI002AFE40FE|nr:MULTISPECIES: DUF637 domain-containing protein [unclassified Yoonia]